MDKSKFLDTSGRALPGLFSPSETIISSSPISASGTSSSIDEAELSGRVGVVGVSRMVPPMEAIVRVLNKMKETEDRSSSSIPLDALKKGIIDLVHTVEELIKNNDSQTCHKDDSQTCRKDDSRTRHRNALEDLCQNVQKIEQELESEGELKAHLRRINQSLSKQKDQLEEDNKELSERNCDLDTELGMVNAEREELFEKYNSLKVKMEADLSKAAEENKLLKQEKNEFDNKYKHVSRPKETKSLGIQTGGIDTLQKRAELNDNHKRVIELEEKLNIANEENARLTSSNIILKENAKQSEERLKMVESLQPNFTEKSLFDEMKEADRRQIGTFDKSIQTEIEYERNSEATVPIKNEELSTVTQNSGKNTSELTRLAEELEGTRVQLAKKAEEISKLNGQVTELTKESSQLKRQGHYASVFFVLSGASAVGASLTMFHLATCISLTVAALTFLAVGCYCLYKANTALSNVEIDQIKNGLDRVIV